MNERNSTGASAKPGRVHRIHHVLPSVMLAACVGVIGGAWFFQYAIGLEPCELCLLERWPYYIGIPLLAIAVMWRRRPIVAVPVFTVVALLFLAGTAVACYHVGVEQHWFAGPTACTGPTTEANSIDALRAQLMAQEPVRCDVIQWSLFGISLAGWNLVASACLAVVSLAALYLEWHVRSLRPSSNPPKDGPARPFAGAEMKSQGR